MPHLLSLSRAARLAGVSRGDLQKKIRKGELKTFEGEIALSDLLRVYPEANPDKSPEFERVEIIKATASPKLRQEEPSLPKPEVLMSRLKALSEMFADAKSRLDRTEEIMSSLERKFDVLSRTTVDRLPAAIGDLHSWLRESRKELAEGPDKKMRFFVRDAFMRIMAAHIKIIPSGHEFFLEGSDSILDASVRAGLHVNYGCSSGNCGSCKARLVKGEVWRIRDHDYVLSEHEKNLGYILMCSNTAVTDLVLEAAEAVSTDDLPFQEIRSTARKTERLRDDLIILHVQTPRTQTLRFMAGQSVDIELDGVSAAYPLASCPCDGRNLQFFIRQNPADPVSMMLFDAPTLPQLAIVRGPTGDFVLQDDSPKPALFIALGDGFPPVKSLIEHAISIDTAEFFHLYWVVSQTKGHYMDGLCRSWADALDNFRYTPLVRAKDADSSFVLDHLLAEYPDLGGFNVYLAGEKRDAQQMYDLLTQNGVAKRALRCLFLDR